MAKTEVIFGQRTEQFDEHPRHERALSTIASMLAPVTHYGVQREPRIEIPQRFWFAPHVPEYCVPDIAAWRREKFIEMQQTGVQHMPDMVCEVLGNNWLYVVAFKKSALYAQLRIPHLWIVNPMTEVLETYTVKPYGIAVYRQQHRALGDQLFSAPPFETSELDLGKLWERANG